MSRCWSSDGRFYIEAEERSSDSYMDSRTSYSWRVVRSEDDVEIAFFTGHWDQDAGGQSKGGTENVRFSEDGRALIVTPFDGSDERTPLPAPTEAELQAAEKRNKAWSALVSSSPGTQVAVIDHGDAAQLFGRSVRVTYSSEELLRLHVDDFTADVRMRPRRVTTCNGLELVAEHTPQREGFRIFAREVGPPQRHPRTILAEQWQAFVDTSAQRRSVRLTHEDQNVLGHRVRIHWLYTREAVFIKVDGVEVTLQSKGAVVRHGDLQLAVEIVQPADVLLYAVKVDDEKKNDEKKDDGKKPKGKTSR